VALCGVFLVLTQDASVTWSSFATNLQSNPLAYGLGTSAAVAWALYSNLTRRWGRSNDRGAVALFMLATGLAFWLGRLFDPGKGMWSLRVAVEVAVLAMATGMAYVCWDLAMRAGNVLFVASCSYLTPFLSTLVSCLYLGVRPSLALWLGCALIITGSFLSWRSLRPATDATDAPKAR
jgi:drug/metabolite transporter (DMT)-like permease